MQRCKSLHAGKRLSRLAGVVLASTGSNSSPNSGRSLCLHQIFTRRKQRGDHGRGAGLDEPGTATTVCVRLVSASADRRDDRGVETTGGQRRRWTSLSSVIPRDPPYGVVAGYRFDVEFAPITRRRLPISTRPAGSPVRDERSSMRRCRPCGGDWGEPVLRSAGSIRRDSADEIVRDVQAGSARDGTVSIAVDHIARISQC